MAPPGWQLLATLLLLVLPSGCPPLPRAGLREHCWKEEGDLRPPLSSPQLCSQDLGLVGSLPASRSKGVP